MARRRRASVTLLAASVAAGFAVGGSALLGGQAAQAAPAAAPVGDDLPITVTVPEGTGTDGGDTGIDNAQLRWGLNRESGGGAFAGGCNFLSAGTAGNAGSARVWTEGDGFFSGRSGAVSVQKPDSAGQWVQSDWAGRCLDATGTPVTATSVNSSTGNQVVIEGGTGGRTATGGLRLGWTGSFTVAYYGGMTYWSAADPVLELDARGNGRLTATLSGYGTSMDALTEWRPIPGRTVVLAELHGADLGDPAASGQGGFSVLPDYLGVQNGSGLQSSRTGENEAYWGSFPAGFVSFQQLTGQAGYWLTTDGQRDAAKPASALVVNYDAAAPAIVPTPEQGAGGAVPSNPLTQAVAPGAAAAAPAAPAAANLPAGTTLTAARDDGLGLVPDALRGGLGAVALPVAGTVLAVLVSILSGLHLAGRLRMPWSRAR